MKPGCSLNSLVHIHISWHFPPKVEKLVIMYQESEELTRTFYFSLPPSLPGVFLGRGCVSLTSHPFGAEGGGALLRAPRLVNNGVHGFLPLLGFRLPSFDLQVQLPNSFQNLFIFYSIHSGSCLNFQNSHQVFQPSIFIISGGIFNVMARVYTTQLSVNI